MEELTTACGIFGAMFVIATAHLADHETLRTHPVCWRRLAAAAHASLVVRVCGVAGINHNELLSWAMRVSGESYFLSVLSDLAIEPQWRPEWIVPNFLVADVFGRAFGSWHRLPTETAPESRKRRIDDARRWIEEHHLGYLMNFPAVLEGTRRPLQPSLAEFREANFEAAVDAYRQLTDDPSVENLLRISPLVEAYGFPAEAMADVKRVLDRIRGIVSGNDQHTLEVALAVLAHISVLTGNVELANGVAEVCLERARTAKEAHPVFETVARLVECAGAGPSQNAARQTLVRRLEILASILPSSEGMAELVTAIWQLKRLQPELAPLLGKSLAIARLGLLRSAAA
jgi:hypothetical protein